ncbi:MAG: hypothetical protein VR74_07980 [Hyphomonas sp. BRH_c22]|uniref:ribbon-helix-helix domain-containing protein n=1 Tax=Hyphomonas sp. BRH_c22 TaxID=1629710 RepID=UPI0005F14ADE|nr:ribbon-helix-helix domain-containing protein [Hyphomonas sp. BRH_c22]KJS37663.1 MAG: hypothetical protein VR74_07980 [Hyphomonas sp. BRH_c22]
MAKLQAFGIAQEEVQSRLEQRLTKETPLAKQVPAKPLTAEAASPRYPQPGREGKKSITAYVPTPAHKTLKLFAMEHDTTVENLIITALDRLLMDMGQDWTIGTGDEFGVPTDPPKSKRR